MPKETDTLERVREAIRRTGPLTNEQLRHRLGLSRGTIMMALRKLYTAGELGRQRCADNAHFMEYFVVQRHERTG